MGEKEEAIKQLAETILKSGLATNETEALEKAQASFGAEEILKKVQSVDPFLKEDKNATEILEEVTNESKEAKNPEIKEPHTQAVEDKTEIPIKEPQDKTDIKISEVIDLDEESEAEKSAEEE
jgi:hypothetical protein